MLISFGNYFHRIHIIKTYDEDTLIKYLSISNIYLETEYTPQPKVILYSIYYQVPIIIISNQNTIVSSNILISINNTLGLNNNMNDAIHYIISLVLSQEEKLKEIKNDYYYKCNAIINDNIFLNEFIGIMKGLYGKTINYNKNEIINKIKQCDKKELKYILSKTFITDIKTNKLLLSCYKKKNEYINEIQEILYLYRLNHSDNENIITNTTEYEYNGNLDYV